MRECQIHRILLFFFFIVSAIVRYIGTHTCSPAFSAVAVESYRKSVIISAIFYFKSMQWIYDTSALCSDLLSQIFYRYFLREPDSIHRAVKHISVALHISGTNKINYRLSMASAYFDRSLLIRRQMHIQPRLRDQPLFINGCRKLFTGSVIQEFRRFHLLQFHINRNGMSLICADQRMIFVIGIPLFLICSDNFVQYISVNLIFPGLIDSGNHIINIRPAMLIQRDTNHFRLMAKNKADKPAGTGK